MSGMLADKVALITGGSRGIGRAICEEFSRHEARVAVLSTRMDGAQSAAKEMPGETLPLEADVENFAAVQGAVDQTLERFGRLDILVSNAGIARDNLLLRMAEEDWDAVLATNLKGAFNCTKAAVRPMMKAKSGRIIAISSVVGICGNAGQANYAASKAGLIGFTKSMARELATRNITVNAVAPGFIETDMTASLSAAARSAMLSQVPMGRHGLVEEIAHAVSFLASDQASYITGQVLQVDGGMAT